MVYKQDGYTLHKKEVELKNNRKQTIYFFAKKEPKAGEPCDLPDGFTVGVNKHNGFLFVKRKK